MMTLKKFLKIKFIPHKVRNISLLAGTEKKCHGRVIRRITVKMPYASVRILNYYSITEVIWKSINVFFSHNNFSSLTLAGTDSLRRKYYLIFQLMIRKKAA